MVGKRSRTLAVLLLLACFSLNVAAADSVDDGRRIYREGILPSGEPMTAIVAGDVPVLGTQFSCQNCHGQSGMGTAEGTYIVSPIAGQFLFAESPQPARPAYDQDSLARLLRDGLTPGGRQLGEVMPRYQIADEDVSALADFLAGLSSAWSPGVDDTRIRFATVITDDVSEAEREAVLEVLNTFVEEKNRQTRNDSERWDRGSTPASRLPTVHRDWVIEVWALSGPSDTWGEQLEQRYRDNPVFALLSGLSHQSWGPVGRFCERNEIPCLFPGADVTNAEQGDFYTLYYSRGLELEADLIAHHLAEQSASNVIQVYCASGPQQAAGRLRTQLEGTGVKVEDVAFECDESLPLDEITRRLSDGVAVLWLGPEQVSAIREESPSARIYVSSTLMERVFETLTGPTFAAHPYRLPGDIDPALARFKVWAKTRGVELASPRRQAEAFFACLAMKDAVAHIGRFFIRDFALDTLDHAQSIVAYLSYYPRPTLGPRQRFVNKGGYVLPIANGQAETSEAIWILP